MPNKLLNLNELKNKRIVITGCGYKPIRHEFKDLVTGKPTHTELVVDGERTKLNIGSGIALALLDSGAIVHIVSNNKDKLQKLRDALIAETKCLPSQIEYSAIDLLDEKAVKEFIKFLPRDRTIYWVQSVGLGAGSYKVKDDNPYLPLDDIDVGLLEAETTTVLRSTHLLLKEFLPILRGQKETRIVIISSMSAPRTYDLGGTHSAAKGAIDRYANAAMLALEKDNIFVTTVRPGIIDTGMYDVPAVIDAVKHVGKSYGRVYKDNNIPLSPPSAIGQIILDIFQSPAHITSVNLVAKKQWPHEGS